MTFICMLILIIIIHELGHLIAAKECKCGVKTFSIGFGKPLFSKKIGSTVYQIAPILLGGFCELQHEMNYSRSKYAFTNKTYSQKVYISYAGIIMNIISAMIAYVIYSIIHIPIFYMFAFYSLVIGVSNALPIPALDGAYPIAFIFEKKYGKKKCYEKIQSLFSKWFFWLMLLNILSIPYLVYLIWTGVIK
jgi:membrane-associated protease RseP (regulator of RpoE activity)